MSVYTHEDFGQFIRLKRMAKKLTIKELAILMNVRESVIIQLEHNRIMPSFPRAIKLMEELDISCAEMIRAVKIHIDLYQTRKIKS